MCQKVSLYKEGKFSRHDSQQKVVIADQFIMTKGMRHA